MGNKPTLRNEFSGKFALIDVVFVHGLTGDPYKTWCNEAGDEFWPNWLKSDLDTVSVYTLGYPASLFEKRTVKEMDMFERAGNVLEHLAGNGIGERPIAFVTHSLGGILTKMILRKSCEAEDEHWRRVSEATKLVVFLSTPHTGTSIAKLSNVVPSSSKHMKLLANESGFLNDLNDHYRALANRREDLTTAVYYERHATKKLVVVSKNAADPGVNKARPVAIDKNHINICKPYDSSDVIYLGIKRHIQNVVKLAEHSSSAVSYSIWGEDYERRSTEDRRDLLQKLIDSGREHHYRYANSAQNQFARQYTKTGLFTAAREDHDNFLSEIETRFLTHVYHPLICRSAPNNEIRTALQEKVIDPLTTKRIGSSRFSAKLILSGLYYLTEQCYIRWDF